VSDYVDQRLSDLRLVLSGARARRGQFRLFRETRITTTAYDADLWIIGSSHVLSFSAGDATCSEVLTCRSGEAGSDPDVEVAHDLSQVRIERAIGDAASYEIHVDTARYDAEALRAEQARLVADLDDDCLLHLFPPADETQMSPMTLLRVEKADDGILSLSTAHSYPQDLAMVVTRSTIRVR
jgi:hypothetical protein